MSRTVTPANGFATAGRGGPAGAEPGNGWPVGGMVGGAENGMAGGAGCGTTPVGGMADGMGCGAVGCAGRTTVRLPSPSAGPAGDAAGPDSPGAGCESPVGVPQRRQNGVETSSPQWAQNRGISAPESVGWRSRPHPRAPGGSARWGAHPIDTAQDSPSCWAASPKSADSTTAPRRFRHHSMRRSGRLVGRSSV
ncbi:hypothetical protein GCM10025786_29260 [Nocardioides caeni]